MGFRCGIVGLPNVGKSTLFTALSRTQVEAANYPFCTIEPNVGMVPVPDERLNKIAAIMQSKQIIPASMQFVDIAGLVKGAAQGEGLGNKFLSNIRETQAIAHVVRCFEDENITHVSGAIDPLADIQVIDTELQLSDIELIEKAQRKVQKLIKTGDKTVQRKLECTKTLLDTLNDGKSARELSWDDEDDQAYVSSLQLITAKPVVLIANVEEASVKDGNAISKTVAEYAKTHGCQFVTICAAIEAEIAQLDDDDQKEFLESLELDEPGLNRVIRAGYDLLELQTYFTCGPKEARAWTIRLGDTAPQAAGVIHTDFEHGFIRAEVIAYEDYVACNGEAGAKEAGKWRQEGKDYIVQDGDVILFRFNV